MIKLTKKQRHKAYKYVLKLILRDYIPYNGICTHLSDWMEENVSGYRIISHFHQITELFPEFARFEPKDHYEFSQHWWSRLTEEGKQSRIDCMKQCMKETK